MRNLFLLATALGLLSTAGCQVTQAALKSDDGRTVARSINDVNAQRTMRARMVRAHGFKLGGVDVEVREGSALLTGVVPRVEDRIEAERIAWSAPGISSLGNELRVGNKQGIVRNTKDGVLEKSVRTRLIANSTVDAIDLNIETHDGVVYLLGMVDSEVERETATRIASTTRGAQEVVSYLTVKGGVKSAAALDPVFVAPQIAPQVLPYPVPATPAAPAWKMPEETVTIAPVVPQSPLAQMDLGGTLNVTPATPDYRDPITGEPIVLPPGATLTTLGESRIIEIPVNAGEDYNLGAPFYIDPDNGERVPVVYRAGN